MHAAKISYAGATSSTMTVDFLHADCRASLRGWRTCTTLYMTPSRTPCTIVLPQSSYSESPKPPVPHRESGSEVLFSPAAESICIASPTADRTCIDWESTITGACSRNFCFKPDLPGERNRLVLTCTAALGGVKPLSTSSIKLALSVCSKKVGFNPDLPEERRRLVLTMAPVDWAAEWLRPVTPNFKMVGPILSQPGRPLPADLEVTSWSHT